MLIETPSYLAAIQIFDSHEAAYLPVPLDVEGMDVEQAAAQIRRPSAPPLHAARLPEPHWHHPEPRTPPTARDPAAQHTLLVLEDDAYYDLRHEGEPLPPVTALASNPGGVYRNVQQDHRAFGLRVGYLYAQPPLVTCLAHLKQLTDLRPARSPSASPCASASVVCSNRRSPCARPTAPDDALLEALADPAPGGEGRGYSGHVPRWACSSSSPYHLARMPPHYCLLLWSAAWSMCRVRVFTLMTRSAETGLAGGQHAAPELRLRERRGHPSWHPPAGRYPA